MQEIVKVLVFVVYFNLAAAGIPQRQTEIPQNEDCGYNGYINLANKCNWPLQECSIYSADFKNYQYWCSIMNNFHSDRRSGTTDANYNRYLSCQSNLSKKEFNRRNLGSRPPTKSPISQYSAYGSSLYPFDSALPTSVDWASSMTPIKDQGGCGSCWAFASIGICEWWYKNKNSTTVILSEQALISCDTIDFGCNGGWPQIALDYLAANGTADSTYYYTGTNSACNISPYQTYKCPNQNYEWYLPSSAPTGNCTRLRQLLANGPVAATIYVTSSFIQYQSGLYSETNCPSNGIVNHGIDVVGFVQEPTTGKDAFLIRNSWGTYWGINGYMYIDASQNWCSLCSYFWYY